MKELLPADGGDAEEMLAAFAYEGVSIETLAADLQREGTQSFAMSWQDLLECLAAKGVALKKKQA